jgi:Type IV secretion system pilin
MKQKIFQNQYLVVTFLLVFSFFNTVFGAGDDFLFTSSKPAEPKDFMSIVCLVVKLALDFVPYLVVIAIGAFLQGLIKYVGHGDNEEKKSEGRKMMIYGIVGFFFMVSVWGVLSLFTNSFGVQLAIPQFIANQSVGCLSF